MSDCSTNAFKVPACSEQKTCGGCCKTCENGEHLLTIHCKVHHVTIGGESRCYCGGEDYVKRTDTIEQRYERLAQVVKGLLKVISQMLSGTPLVNTQYFEIKQKIKEIGVSVDD